MSNYSKTTDFEAKDSLPTGDSGKIIRGAEFETEFDAISTAIATKADTAGPTFTGTLTFETISDGTIGVTAFVDEDDMSSDSATLVPTQQSVKAYVDSQVTAQDLDFQADSGGALSIDLDSETLTFTGGTGITTAGSGNDVEFAIDSTVATLTGSQTLISKTLTSPVLNGSVTGTAVLDEDNMASNSATKLATQQSIKAYVDTTVAATNELVEDSSPQLGGTLDLNGNNITGTGNINNTGTVTTDGLTVEGSSGSTLNNVNFLNTSTAYAATANRLGLGTTNSVGANYTYIEANNDVADGRPSLNFYTGDTATKRLRITDGGDVEFYEDGGSTAKLTWDASDEDLKFADNAKATFGAGNDLQIYHTGSHSFIQDTGVGDLYLATNGDKIILRNTTLGESFFEGTSNGDAKIFYNGLEKLATTSTGIDVTGTVTADGLTVDGSSSGRVTSAEFKNNLNAGGTEVAINLANQGGTSNADVNLVANRVGANFGSDFYIETSDGVDGTNRKRLNIGENGDISFYEDTGTTAKFFWDASAESLGIGTTSIAAGTKLQVAGETRIYPDSGTGVLRFGSGGVEKGKLSVDASSNMAFETGGSERMRIDSSGNVGIGTDSPAKELHLASAQPDFRMQDTDGTDQYAEFTESNGSLFIGSRNGASDGQILFRGLGGGSSNEYMRLDSAGNLLVNGTNSTGKLVVDGDANAYTARFNSSTTTGQAFGTRIRAGTNSSDYALFVEDTSASSMFAVRGDGKVGIGTSSPASVLHLFNSSTASSSLSEGLTLSSNAGSENDRLPAITWDYGTTGTPTFAAVDASRSSGTGGNLLFHTATTGGTLTEAMRINSAGNVGIGTSTPDTLLELVGDDPILTIRDSATGSATANATLRLAETGASDTLDAYWDIKAVGGDLQFIDNWNEGGGTGTRLVIDDSGNVKIGTATDRFSFLTASTANLQIDGGVVFEPGSGNNVELFNYRSTDMLFGNSGAEAMRLDSSGNLLVGLTGVSGIATGSTADNGIYLDGANGAVVAQSSANKNFYASKATGYSDPDFISFQVAGSSVGSIGTAGNRVYISGPSASLHSGLIFTDNGSEGIIAPSTNAGAVANGTTDLGYSGGRFKDGHFSGNINANTFTAIDGLYVGGTGFANKLDDYEEGGWTPVVADASSGGNEATTATAVGRYTKVGRVVTVDCYINNVTTTGLTAGLGVFVTDLPFIAQGATYAIGSVEATNVAFTGTVVARVDNSGTYVRLVDITSGGSSSSVIVSDLTSGSADIIFTATYMAV